MTDPSVTERRRAARMLLATPLIAGVDRPADHALIRRHADALTRFFADQAGWRLTVDETGARLFKNPGPSLLPRHRPRTKSSTSVFDPLHYATCCLVLAACEEADRGAITARALFDQVATLASATLPSGFDLSCRDDRIRFVHAAAWAEEIGVLRPQEGDLHGFEAAGEVDVLWHVDTWVLARVLVASQPPSLLAGPDADAFDRAYPATSDGADLRARHRLTRRLLDDPVVYFDDLDDDEVERWRRLRNSLPGILADNVGIELEVRSEGVVTVDAGPDNDGEDVGGITDLAFPGTGADAHAALLLCAWFSEARPDGDPASSEDIDAVIAEAATTYADYWSATAAADPAGVARRAVTLLAALGLVAVAADGAVRPRPAIRRYRPLPPATPAAPTLATLEMCP